MTATVDLTNPIFTDPKSRAGALRGHPLAEMVRIARSAASWTA